MVAVAVQAQARDAASWLALARKVERLGFDALLAADHVGMRPSPFVALAAAAAVTRRIGLGTYVVNAGIRDPLLLASDVATLDLVSDGRARLGIGAGHTPAEWAGVGRERPSVQDRVRRCIAVAESVRALLAGQLVKLHSDVLQVEASLTAPRPERTVPLTVGGANSSLLQWAGEHAEVVGLTGMGKTLADGYGHEARWRVSQFERQLDLIRQGADRREHGAPELEALVQMVDVTDDPEKAVHELATELDVPIADLLEVPFLLVGTRDEIVSKIRARQQRWGIDRIVVREDAIDALGPLLSRLSDDK